MARPPNLSASNGKFPLTPHSSGRWCKRIKGKTYYFGRDKEKALEEFLRRRDELYPELTRGEQENKAVDPTAPLAVILGAFVKELPPDDIAYAMLVWMGLSEAKRDAVRSAAGKLTDAAVRKVRRALK